MRRLQGLISVVALSMLTGAALAQNSQGTFDPYPSNFSFRLGVVWPSTDPLRTIENNWLSIGADYTFTKQFFKNSETYLSIDWIGRSGTGAHGTYWPLLVNQRFYTGTRGEESRTYLIAGIGVVIFDVLNADTVLGGRLGGGIEFTPRLFAEGSYFLSDASAGGIRANSFGVYIGYRF